MKQEFCFGLTWNGLEEKITLMRGWSAVNGRSNTGSINISYALHQISSQWILDVYPTSVIIKKELKLDLMLHTICSTLFCTVKFCSDYHLVSSFHSHQEPTKCFFLFVGGLDFCDFFWLVGFLAKYFSLHSCHKAWHVLANSLKRELVPEKT